MGRILGIIALGLAGLVLAVSLSFGAFALAGRSVGEPATVQLTTSSPAHHHPKERTETPTPPPSSSPSPDDHGGGGGGHGSDD